MFRPQDIFDPSSPGPPDPPERVRELWPQARGELLAFANALERGRSDITAAQLRMAVRLADAYAKSVTG